MQNRKEHLHISKPKFTNVFFDLDGTLTDPKDGIVNSYLFALEKLGLNESDPDKIASYIGSSLHLYFAEVHGLNEADLETAVAYYREHFGVKGLYENRLYDGIAELLNKLQTAKTNLYLVTSKPTVYAKEILDHFEINKHFKNVYGSELTVENTNKEELIAVCLSSENIIPTECIMVGDRMHDVNGAKANGVTSCAVTFGYGSKQNLRFVSRILLCKMSKNWKEY